MIHRGLIYFRLGDDQRGIKDLESALKYQPLNLLAKEKLSLALRRLSRFEEAMIITTEIVALKDEEKKKKQFHEELMRQQELIRATESITTAPSVAASHSIENDSESCDLAHSRGMEHEEEEGHLDAMSIRTERSRPLDGNVSGGSSVVRAGKVKHIPTGTASGTSAISVNPAVASMLQRATKCPIGGR